MNLVCRTCEYRRGNVCTKVKLAEAAVHFLKECPEDLWVQRQTVSISSDPQIPRIAPYRNEPSNGKRWEGSAPWKDIQVSVLLPILEYNPTLDLVLECLRRQTIKSLIYIIDTGSVDTTEKIASLRDSHTEVIQLRLQGWYHPSWPVAAGLDAAWGCLNTPYAFLTHDDCFIKQQDTLEKLVDLCQDHPAVGHQITERDDPDWQTSFGHTFLMLDVKVCDTIPLIWNMRAWATILGRTLSQDKCVPGYPDTETMMNLLFRLRGWTPSFSPQKGIPLFLGTEDNWARNNNEWFDHFRSLTGGFLYSPSHFAKTSVRMEDAMKDCRERLKRWTSR